MAKSSPTTFLYIRSDNPKSKIKNLKWLRSVGVILLLTVSMRLADAQQTGKISRIGFLDNGTASDSAILWDQCRQELNKLGWIEGKSLAIEHRYAEGKYERLTELAADLVRLKVDLVAVSETTPALAAKSATTTIPIVFTNAGDPVAAGLVATLGRPGGNITGLASLSTQLNTKRLEVLKDAVPKLSRVGLLVPAGHGPGSGLQLKELKPAALALNLKLEEIETQFDAQSLESAFDTARQKQVNAIMTTVNRNFLVERKRIANLAVKYRWPAIYFQKEFIDDGGLMSYGADYNDLFRNAAHYVDKILRGSKPADLPVQQATKFEFVINLKAAKQIGLTIPVKMLERANKVIK